MPILWSRCCWSYHAEYSVPNLLRLKVRILKLQSCAFQISHNIRFHLALNRNSVGRKYLENIPNLLCLWSALWASRSTKEQPVVNTFVNKFNPGAGNIQDQNLDKLYNKSFTEWLQYHVHYHHNQVLHCLLPVVHQQIWLPNVFWWNSDILNVSILRFIPDKISISPLLKYQTAKLDGF